MEETFVVCSMAGMRQLNTFDGIKWHQIKDMGYGESGFLTVKSVSSNHFQLKTVQGWSGLTLTRLFLYKPLFIYFSPILGII